MPKRVATEDLKRFCIEAILKSGLQPKDAGIIAEVLVTTDSWGTFSHGTGNLRNYLKALRAGGIDPCGKPEIVAEGESWAVVDNHAGMGMLGSCLAMETAIEKARTHTIAWAGVRNGSHFGAAGYYANMAAHRDMLGIALSNADPNMVVPGARGHVIGNNPLAYAVPAGEEDPIFLDVAMSAVAASKIFSIQALGLPIPPVWITDEEGMPTQDASHWPAKGSMLPMAGHKGYGIALLIEIMAGLLPGAAALDEAKSWIFDATKKAGLGQSFLVIHINSIVPIEEFKARVDLIIRKIRGSPRAKDAERIYLPGEMEWERRRDALKNGIPLPDLTVASLRGAGEDLGLDTGMFCD